MTKPFLFLVGVAAALGVGLGLAFIGGLAVGASRASASPTVQAAPALGPGGSQSGGVGQSGGMQQRMPGAGGIEQGVSGQGRQFQRPGEAMSPGDFMAGRGGLMGTVTGIDGNTVTIDTPQGPVRAAIGEDTVITRIAPATAADLEDGVAVRVITQAANGEAPEAISITIVPEGDFTTTEQVPQQRGELPRGRMGP